MEPPTNAAPHVVAEASQGHVADGGLEADHQRHGDQNKQFDEENVSLK